MVTFDRFLTVESFVSGKVKVIRVVRYDPKLTPSQTRDVVRNVWLGVLSVRQRWDYAVRGEPLEYSSVG
jgi:hypothetical protein